MAILIRLPVSVTLEEKTGSDRLGKYTLWLRQEFKGDLEQ